MFTVTVTHGIFACVLKSKYPFAMSNDTTLITRK